MELHIRLDGRKGLTDQLYQQLRAGIDSGHLAAGTQLPPTRLLAEQLGVSRKTVAEAYSRLTYDNLLLSLIHISEPTRPCGPSRMPSSA